jgi:pantoate--beta-alanine ligase
LTLQQIADPLAMRAWSRAARATGKRIGFVPTMGFLHEGHLRLVDRAAADCDLVVMSIFVNPLQFGPREDFSSYPRDLGRDRTLAEGRGVDLLFVPEAAAMYAQPPEIRISPGRLAEHLCGPWRPGHFEGVLTVVAKLFNIVEPDVAVFGRKDAQQARLILRMVEDLHFPVTINVAPTTREDDGLALSSRNTYLGSGDRAAAVKLSLALEEGHKAFRAGERNAQSILAAARKVLDAEPAIRLQYLEAVDPRTLQPVSTVSDETIFAVAAFLGKTRLIDNVILGQGLAADERVRAAVGIA